MRAPLPAALALALACGPASAFTFFSLGSGDIEGGYFATARALCDVINRSHPGELRCSPEATSGSLYNLAALQRGEIEFALVQSDWQNLAFNGTGRFADDGPMTELRSVMSLYPESVTVVARHDSGITKFTDLLGKRLDIGNPGSGRRATLGTLLGAFDLGPEDFAALLELPTGSAITELCAGRIDATILIVGHPNGAVGRALAECGATLVPVNGPLIDKVLSVNPDYTATMIPSGTYPEVAEAVPAFAVTATLVTTARTDPALVQTFVSEALEHLDLLAARTPILAGLDPRTMRSQGLTAPLHPGAEAAFDALIPPS